METETTIEQPNSVEIGINAKGMYSGKVKVYAHTIEDAFKTCVLKAEELSSLIAQKNQTTPE